MLVPPEVFGLSACCADSYKGKYEAVTGVHLSWLASGVSQVAATDGIVFAATTWREPLRRTRKGCQLTIPRKAWDTAIKRKQRRGRALFVDEQKGKTTIGFEDQSHAKVAPLDGLYPSPEEYIPDYEPSKSVSIVLDVAALSKLLKTLKPLSKGKDGYHRVKITVPTDPSQAVLLTCKTAETQTQAAIMPLKEERRHD